MVQFCRIGISLLVILATQSAAQARPFTVMVYNVENLFDADGVAAYDEYQPSHYSPAHVQTKLDNIARVVAAMGDGKGPDIILFQEIEIDQTPDREPGADQRLKRTLEARGLRGYTMVSGDEGPGKKHEDGHLRAVKCVTFTRFPIKSVRNHPILNARNILEVQVDVDGAPLYLFNNHWKSGASDPALERVRLENARVLRARIDELLRLDAQADIILGGDFNSQYNQNRRYGAQMPETALNEVLRSQGNELAIRGPQRDLYNLWFELPVEKRGSDIFRGEWGTLMQIIVSRGLYDFRGVQYVDNSFGVLKVKGLNSTPEGTPVRWSNDGPAGSGFADHFPIYAKFITVTENRPDRWLNLTRPSPNDESPSQAVRAPEPAMDLSKALSVADVKDVTALRDGSFNGKLMRVQGTVAPGDRLMVQVAQQTWDLYVPDPKLRDALRARWKTGMKINFYGILGQYRGRWQFTIQQEGWTVAK